MVGTVDQRRLHVHHREPGLAAGGHRFLDALVDGLDVLSRNRAADDTIHELVASATLLRLELNHRVTVLALAARLTDMTSFDAHGLGQRFAICHLRTSNVRVHPELAHHAVHQHVEVKLAHAIEHGLPGLLVGVNAERRIFFGQPRQRRAHLVLVSTRLRLHRDRDHRLREGDGLQHDRLADVTQGVACGRVLEPDHGRDVAGRHLGNLFPVVGVHLQQAPDSLALALGGVQRVGTRLHRAGIYAHVGELADVRIDGNLERQRGERRVRVRSAGELLFGLGIETSYRRHVERRRQVVNDAVEHRLHAFIF